MKDMHNAIHLSHDLLISYLLLVTAQSTANPHGLLECARQALTDRIPDLIDVQAMGPEFGNMVISRVNALLDSAARSIPPAESVRE